MKALDKKVALVTGGGSGLGEAIARVLSEAGAQVVVGDIKKASAERVVSSLGRPQDTMALCFDVGSEVQSEEALAQVKERFGKVDIIINNAGTDVTLPIDELKFEEFDRVVQTNLRGPFVLSKIAFPLMKAQGGGSIVNIVSTAAKRTWPNASAYHASKWGLLGLSHALHVEGRKDNIKVSAVISGGLRTPFILDRFPDVDPNLLQDPANVAKTVLFLLMQPEETVIPEITVIPMRETSWP